MIEIISLIYKCPKYLAHICEEIKASLVNEQMIGRIVANDPSPEVLAALPTCGLPYTIYNDPKPDDYYLNRVYRAWNYAGATSKASAVCFVNSDMVFGKDWLLALCECYSIFEGKVIPCSLLIESGNMPSKWPAYTMDFGRTLETINKEAFYEHEKTVEPHILYKGGLYMPCLLPQRFFDKNSLIYFPYPEGNIYKGGIGAYGTEFVESGDSWYFKQLQAKYGLEHITTSDSRVYHLQEGELRS